MSASVRGFRSPRFQATLAAILCVALSSCEQKPVPTEPRPPDVVLVVIDNLRADHLGAFGYPRPTSPEFDAISAHGVLFTEGHATSSWTKPSVASLFTSVLPEEHGAVSFTRHLREDLPTLAEIFTAADYESIGVSGNFVHVNATTGLARGFTKFTALSFPVLDPGQDSLFTLRSDDDRVTRLRAPTAGEVNDVALPIVSAPRERPLFLYVHFMDPHAGFSPPAERLRAVLGGAERSGPLPEPIDTDGVVSFARNPGAAGDADVQRLIDLYDGEIATVDAALGDLWRSLDQRPGRKILAVVSDHGEEFGEHRGFFHGLTLHAEVLRVPVLLVDSERRPATGERRSLPVDLIDVGPTLLAMAGLEAPPSMRGRNLLGETEARGRDLIAELHCDPLFEDHVRPRRHRGALLRWPWKVLADREGSHTWFRADRDPMEREALLAGSLELGPEALRAGAELGRITRAGSLEACREVPSLDEDERSRLRSLGYAE